MSGFALKIIALVFMTADHLSIIFGDLPFLRMPGRLAAPIFAFIVSEGVIHTSDRNKYMLRLYAFAVLMEFCNMLTGYEIRNNIMATFFLTVINITAIENVLNKKYIWLAAFALQLPAAFADTAALRILLPSPATCEGGIMWVVLSMAFYFLKEDKLLRIMPLILIAAVQFPYANPGTAFGTSYQWLMAFAAVFILLYSGEKGRKMKYFFYIYYPAHIYLFYMISHLCP